MTQAWQQRRTQRDCAAQETNWSADLFRCLLAGLRAQGVEVPPRVQKAPEALQAAEFRGLLFDAMHDQWKASQLAGGTKDSARIGRMLKSWLTTDLCPWRWWRR